MIRPLVFSGVAVLSLTALVAQSVAKPKQEKAPAAALPASAKKLSFNESVQPILAENCYQCHGADPGSRKAGLRLDRAETAFKPLKEGGPALIPGKPDESPLIQRIESKDEKKRMPPMEAHKTLQPEQIALLRKWVGEGAVYEEHWSFITPKRPALPSVSNPPANWKRNPVDRFILARLEREKLAPSPEEERRTLIRRVTLDLTGLLPTPAETEAFVSDRSRDAYEKVVDRLLASPRYGEHRARYWLDYARYADTHGIHFDNYRAIWPYRDYVIRAFNENKPFDTFVREQLAGDLLPARNFDQLVATGFVRCNLTTNEGGTIPEEVFVNQTRDRVEAFGATFLGLTTGCAACHDHKFDPFTQKDHYSLAAFLNNTVEKPWDLNIEDPAPVFRLPPDETRASAEVILKARAQLWEKLNERRARSGELIAAWLAQGNRPLPVDQTGLEVRLKLDEGKGDVVKNSAPNAKIAQFKADTNPLVWGEKSWLWPSVRMDILSRLRLGEAGEVEADEKFSAGGWIMLRATPGGGVKGGTGTGTLFGRMGGEKLKGGPGWDVYHEGLFLTINITRDGELENAPAGVAAADSSNAGNNAAKKEVSGEPRRAGLQVVTRMPAVVRDEWQHIFFTYDGSRRASGIKLYVNGTVVDTSSKLDTLTAKDSIRTDAAMHLGRRDDYQPMRETRFQDFRFYRRALTPEEIARLPFEDVAAEIVARQPNPAAWSTDEKFVVVERFFLGEKELETKALAAGVAAHDAAFDALTRDGKPTLIALEKNTPAYADLLKRGDYYARTERVEPAVPHFLPKLPANAPPNRRGLADWLLTPEQPLMTRVTVNRIWQELFGRGLVESAGDFGIMGDRPSHPLLLDWLAVEFRESGWDVKKFYRLLVTSATYRQSAVTTPDRLAKDPANKLLSRGPRFRMDGEMLRDSALMASGLLVEKIGGPSVKPYQPTGIWEEVAMPESNTRNYVADKGDNLYRRSVYTFWKRASPPATLESFDATSRETVCARRARSNTPLQALITMNDPQWVEAARKLGEHAIKASPAPETRVDFMAQATLGRKLTPKESTAILQTGEIIRSKLAANVDAAKQLLAVGDSKSDESIAPVELATWTMVASEFLNLDEFLTK
ncbi:MAG: DUF1553 domain-containing protein [Opitutus sp.]